MTEDIADRIDVARAIGLHPLQQDDTLKEGTHYTVLAYTDWTDLFIPTLIKWRHGPTDDLTDLQTSERHKQQAIRDAQTTQGVTSDA